MINNVGCINESNVENEVGGLCCFVVYVVIALYYRGVNRLMLLADFTGNRLSDVLFIPTNYPLGRHKYMFEAVC